MINDEERKRIKKKYAPLYWAEGKIMKDNDDVIMCNYYITQQIAAHKSLIRELLDDIQDLRVIIKKIDVKAYDEYYEGKTK